MTLGKVGQRLLFMAKIGGNTMALDPVTATQNAITAFFEFLSTPAGQKAADRFLEIDKFFHNKLADLFNKLHKNVAPDAPDPAATPTVPAPSNVSSIQNVG